MRYSENATYRDLFEKLLDSAFLIEYETLHIRDANLASERILQWPVEKMMTMTISDIVDPNEKTQFLHELRIAKRRYHPREFDSTWIDREGNKITMRVGACSLRLSDGKDVLQVIAKNVMREREAERKAAQFVKDLELLNAKLEELSVTDEMTQLANFRHFKTQLKIEHERSFRYRTPYTLLFCDVDHFKVYNDKNGHPAGDEVLKKVAEILRANQRGTDLAARYGGEEFVVLCPHTDLQQALGVAERIRKAVEAVPFPGNATQPLGKVSVSIGVARFPENGNTPDEVLKSADEAVYQSKKNGRNQITSAAHSGQEKKIA